MATKPQSHGRAPLEGHARLVFERLGYSVTYDGEDLKAERDDKVVSVVTVEDEKPPHVEADADIDKYCLVTRADDAPSLKRTAESRLPAETDWAVIGLEKAATATSSLELGRRVLPRSEGASTTPRRAPPLLRTPRRF